MRQRLTQNNAPAGRSASSFPTRNGAAMTMKEIPYDYVATFTLAGVHGNRVQDVINISIDGAFTAVAIGYSFIPATLPVATATVPPLTGDLASLFTDMLEDPRHLRQCIIAKLCGISFKYSIVDSATGRELQNQPIHNIAGLGEPGGNRPFRPLAKPVLFEPRSTIRIEVEEISVGPIYSGAQLYMVLHGYKMLGYGAQP